MGFATYAIGLLVAVVSAFLYSKSDLLLIIYANNPARIPQVSNFRSSDIIHGDTVRNCEDAIYSPVGRFLILSCDPGRDQWNTVMVCNVSDVRRLCAELIEVFQGVFENHEAPPETGLYFLSTTATTSTAPEKIKLLDFPANASEWHPLGVDYLDESQRLFVVNHGVQGQKIAPRIEIFKVFAGDRAAAHITTVQHPLIMAPNSIAAISDNEFLVTNDHYFPCAFSEILCRLETYLGPPGGSVVYVRLSPQGTAIEEIKVLKRLPGANGIALLNSTSLAVVALSNAAVNIYDFDRAPQSAPTLTPKQIVKVPFLPDNIKRDENGKLLIAGHPFPRAIEKIAQNNRFCQGAGAETDPRCKLDFLSWIAEWSESDGLRTIHSGRSWGTATTALRDVTSGIGYAVALYGKGIMRWEE